MQPDCTCLAYFRPLLKTVTQKESQPFVYNEKTEIMVGYDNADSFSMIFLSYIFFYDIDCFFFGSEAKGKYIEGAGLYGFGMWFIGGDSNNILLNAINSGMGNQQCT